MSATMRHLKDDLHQDPRELERDADRARADLERTLEALEQRISPSAIVDRTMRIVRENGGDFGRNLATQVRNNPVPTILAGISLAWLMTASNRPPRQIERRAGAHGAGTRQRMTSAASAARGAAGQAAQSTRTAAGRAAHATRSAASATRSAASRAARSTRSAAGYASGTAREVADGVVDASRSVRHGYSYMGREQPFALGALAIAAGAAIGALLPSTDAEDDWIGERSDEATDRMRASAGRRWEQAKERAADVAERAVEKERDHLSDSDQGSTAADGKSKTDTSRSGSPSGDEPRRTGGAAGTGYGDYGDGRSADSSQRRSPDEEVADRSTRRDPLSGGTTQPMTGGTSRSS